MGLICARCGIGLVIVAVWEFEWLNLHSEARFKGVDSRASVSEGGKNLICGGTRTSLNAHGRHSYMMYNLKAREFSAARLLN